MNKEPTRLTSSEARSKKYWFISNNMANSKQWRPISWQGWLTFAVFYIVVFLEICGFYKLVIITDQSIPHVILFLIIVFSTAGCMNLIVNNKGLVNHWN